MIGQKQLKQKFKEMFDNKCLPRTMLLVGTVGSGRKMFAHELAEMCKVDIIESGIGVDDVREISKISNERVDATIYLIPDVEQMSAAGQNAMLKLLEEPPNDATFILTVVQENLILPTIHSRCAVFYMDAYTSDDIDSYLLQHYPEYVSDTDLSKVIHQVCVCPGEIDRLASQDIKGFIDYGKLVYKNIAKVSGSNSFKIGNKINLSADENKDKYDLILFWKYFIQLCMEHIQEEPKRCADAISITTKSIQALRVKGINKQMCMDMWILDIRKAWI